MSKVFKVAVIIPCHNEEDTILNLITEIKKTSFPSNFVIEPIVINDASIDKTKQILLNHQIKFIDLAVNPGLLSYQAKENDIKYISGKDFYKYQFMRQFEIYTGMKVDENDYNKISIGC